METVVQVLAVLAVAGAVVFGVLALLDTAHWAARRTAASRQRRG